MKLHLINTPLGFFDHNHNNPVLLSGAWILRSQEYNNFIKSSEITLAPYHWADNDKFSRDFDYISELVEEVLSILANELNILHKVDYPISFWRILLKPWLNSFIPSVFDRWETIDNCIKNYDIESASVLNFDLCDLVPNSTSDFNSYYNLEDFWNEFIFSEILKNHPKTKEIDLIETSGTATQTNIIGSQLDFKINSRIRVFKFLKSLMHKLLSLLNNFKSSDTIFFHNYENIKDKLTIESKLKYLPSHFISQPLPLFEFNLNKREALSLSSVNNSEFEFFLVKLIHKQIPKIFIEGFDFLIQNEYKKWPSTPKAIVCSGSIYSDDYFKFYLADKITNKNSKLFILQHGGHYGIGKHSNMLDYELQICDKFISWGWKNNSDNIITLPSMKISRMISSSSYSKEGSLLIIGQDFTRYSYHMYSYPVSSGYLSYENDLKDFIINLSDKIESNTILRFKHGGSFGWNEMIEFEKTFPKITLDKADKPLASEVARSRLCVQTSNFTTYLESLALNIPTIIFWDPKFNNLTDDANLYFDDLAKAKIFFSDPVEAANHINNIWEDVDRWWASDTVQESRANFVKNYASCSESYINDFVHFMKENT